MLLWIRKRSYKPNKSTTYYTYRWYSDGYIEVRIPSNGNKLIGDFASNTYQSNIYIYVVSDINVTGPTETDCSQNSAQDRTSLLHCRG